MERPEEVERGRAYLWLWDVQGVERDPVSGQHLVGSLLEVQGDAAVDEAREGPSALVEQHQRLLQAREEERRFVSAQPVCRGGWARHIPV